MSHAFGETCRRHGVPVAVERSRSGNGAHAWIFFAGSAAGGLGAASWGLPDNRNDGTPARYRVQILRSLFSQPRHDAVGRLRQLDRPAASRARKKRRKQRLCRRGISRPIPISGPFCPGSRRWRDQTLIVWSKKPARPGKSLRCEFPSIDEDEEPWLAPPSRRRAPPAIEGPLPTCNHDRSTPIRFTFRVHELPPSLIARLIRLAAFQNPEFYAAQAMRRSTHDKPRIISCAELTSRHIGLPRGCFDAACGLLTSLGVVATIEDHRVIGAPISLSFTGQFAPGSGNRRLPLCRRMILAFSRRRRHLARRSSPFA